LDRGRTVGISRSSARGFWARRAFKCHVGDAETARAAVKAVQYPPHGKRGMAAGIRAAEFAGIPPVEHVAWSNRENPACL